MPVTGCTGHNGPFTDGSGYGYCVTMSAAVGLFALSRVVFLSLGLLARIIGHTAPSANHEPVETLVWCLHMD